VKGETTAPRSTGRAPGLSPLAALVRRHDRDRYQTALFAPAARREALFALYAFNYEIARVREIVTQPMLGQIRLQWWREVIDAAFAGAAPRAHVVAVPLAAAIGEFGLARENFDRMIDARERDLADAAPADMAALEAYAAASSGGLVQLAVAVLGAGEEPIAHTAAGEVGIAYALAGLLRAMPYHAGSGRRYIPDAVAVSAALDPADYAARRPTPALCAAAREIAEAARRRLAAARRLHRSVPRAARPALLPAVIADRSLIRLRRAGDNPFAPELRLPDPMQSWRLAAAMLTGRF
jgi:NADH dehydrogenase [ubiquinone] 1 alpha subcomplex assembly factor 6